MTLALFCWGTCGTDYLKKEWFTRMVAMHYLRSTPVRRLWMRTLAALLIAVVMLGLAAYLDRVEVVAAI